MDILLIVACVYMAYSNVTSLMEIPLAEWGLVQYVMALLTVLLLAVGGLKGWQFYKKKKVAAEAPAEKDAAGEAPTQQAEAQPPEKPPEPAQLDLAKPAPPPAVPPPDDNSLEEWERETADFHYTLVELPDEKKDA